MKITWRVLTEPVSFKVPENFLRRRLFPQPAGKFSGIQRKNNNRFTEIHTDLPDKCLKQEEVDQAALILLNKYQ